MMRVIQLNDTTGNPLTDSVAQNVILLFEAVFPGRIRSYYVEGSFATHTAVSSSDLDLIIVFQDQLDEREREIAQQIGTACKAICRVELDILIVDEYSLRQGAEPMLILGTRCLYGSDQRQSIPILSIEQWTRNRMHAAFWLMVNVFRRQNAQFPLSYPNPRAQFFGYTERMILLPGGQMESSTRDLVRVVGWIATALVAHLERQYVATKRDCARIYRQAIHDQWTSLIEDVFYMCRTAWHYQIPMEKQEQDRLRKICEQTLAFENHFLLIYQQFLIRELTNQDLAPVREALELLCRTSLYHDRVIQIVDELTYHDDIDIQQLAHAALLQLRSSPS